tara:strand:+ start:1332 stop:2015 length:684 start_codon:yes stop_codon:yes gene_type:complete
MDSHNQTNQAKFFAMVQNYTPPINKSIVSKKDQEIINFVKTSGTDIFFTMDMLQKMGEQSLKMLNIFSLLQVIKATMRNFMTPLEDVVPEYTYEKALVSYSKVFYTMFNNGAPNSTPEKAITTLRLYSGFVNSYDSHDVKLITGFDENEFSKRFSSQLEHLLNIQQDWNIYKLAKIHKLSNNLDLTLPEKFTHTVKSIKEKLDKQQANNNEVELNKQIRIANSILKN